MAALRKIIITSVASTSKTQPFFAFHLSSRAASSFVPPPSTARPSTSSFSSSSQSPSSALPPHIGPRPTGPGSFSKPNPSKKKNGKAVKEKLSKNRIFVTNLPYSLPDDTLGELFFKLTSVSPLFVEQPPRTRSTKKNVVRNRGFGFVEWEDVEEGWGAVRKAVEMSGKVEVEGRTLIIATGTVPPRKPVQVQPWQRSQVDEEDEGEEEESEEDWRSEYRREYTIEGGVSWDDVEIVTHKKKL